VNFLQKNKNGSRLKTQANVSRLAVEVKKNVCEMISLFCLFFLRLSKKKYKECVISGQIAWLCI
jgi:hypothetical protein